MFNVFPCLWTTSCKRWRHSFMLVSIKRCPIFLHSSIYCQLELLNWVHVRYLISWWVSCKILLTIKVKMYCRHASVTENCDYRTHEIKIKLRGFLYLRRYLKNVSLSLDCGSAMTHTNFGIAPTAFLRMCFSRRRQRQDEIQVSWFFECLAYCIRTAT